MKLKVKQIHVTFISTPLNGWVYKVEGDLKNNTIKVYRAHKTTVNWNVKAYCSVYNATKRAFIPVTHTGFVDGKYEVTIAKDAYIEDKLLDIIEGLSG